MMLNFCLFRNYCFFGELAFFFCLRAFFGFGTFWGTWTSHHGADKHLKRHNFPSKKRNFRPKKLKNKSGWQAFPSSQNPKHETALFLEKSKKYPKQQKKVLFQLRAIISHNRKFQVYIYILKMDCFRESSLSKRDFPCPPAEWYLSSSPTRSSHVDN